MYNEKIWDILVTTMLASGYTHQHIETPEQGFLEVIDDYGRKLFGTMIKLIRQSCWRRRKPPPYFRRITS